MKLILQANLEIINVELLVKFHMQMHFLQVELTIINDVMKLQVIVLMPKSYTPFITIFLSYSVPLFNFNSKLSISIESNP